MGIYERQYMSNVLEGVRVLDFGRYIAGPFCATLLADLGAEVIRIEKIDGSEDRYTTPINAKGEGAGFVQIGRNKLGITLNPTKPEGREIVKKLVATADVVIANLPAPTLKAMSLDYDSLKAIKEDIILTTVSAFGSEGPYAVKVGFDAVAQAMSGNMYLGGFPGEPRKSYVPYCDFGTASLSAYGTLAAIIHKMKTGQGQLVEGSLLRTSLTIANAALIEQSILEIDRVGSGNRAQTSAPSDAYRTSDGWIMVQIVGNPLWERWARLMGEEKWLTDEKFLTDQSRGDHGELISERMQQWCKTRTTEDALSILAEARIPCGEILAPRDTLQNEHIVATETFKYTDYPSLNSPAPIAEPPVKLSKTPAQIRHRAPTLGEHTHEIMSSLGYSDEELEVLRKQRII